ncbi:four-carbon acid sugar kinase family protein [Paenarthrobacter sp. NPDC057981]|uniref:four-carbon acid sugar kinase family protein n=1 Tax=Paenarthrobacter sp. NPDC057981 TaxID=3346297 RepID=UPI0036DCB920
MATVYVQADDFSGAAEVGSCFAEHGFSAQVLLGVPDVGRTSSRPAPQVIVADTHSRRLPAAAAEALVKNAFSSPEATGAPVLFKKIDSLWRGNVRAEASALTSLGFHAVVAGALPQLQRSIVAGRALIAGTPLPQTNLWQAEASPPPADVASLLRPQNPDSVKTLDLANVRSRSLSTTLAGLLNYDQPQLVVADGETVQDLAHVVDALVELHFHAGGRRVVLVGTGGAATLLAIRLTKTAQPALEVPAADPATIEPQASARPVLAVVGSASTTAQSQLAQLENRGFTVVRLLVHGGATDADGPQLTLASATLKAGNHVAVTVSEAQIVPAKAPSIVKALSQFAAEATKATPADLILTGGETAREVLNTIGRTSMVPLTAVQHGAVLGRADDGTLVGTKPGSFGDDLALVQLYDAILRYRPPNPHASLIPTKLPTNLEQQ